MPKEMTIKKLEAIKGLVDEIIGYFGEMEMDESKPKDKAPKVKSIDDLKKRAAKMDMDYE